MVKIYPVPEGEQVSKDYKITINGMAVEAYTARVSAIPFNTVWPGHQRPLDQTEMASFIYFGMDEPVNLMVEPLRDFSEVVVRPVSKNIEAVTEGRKISLTIEKAGQYTLELDGFHHALHIFADPIGDYDVNIQDDNTLYFGPGVHYPGIIEMKDNQTIYIDGGAVVHCSVIAENKKNIRILGNGILDNSTFQREDSSCLRCPTLATFKNCKNIEIKGIIFKDACSWTVTFFNCDNILIDNVKTIGMWRYNSDGIDFVNSANGIVRNSFLRNFDDVIVLKGLKGYDTRNVENILVEGCTLWCDWGRALEIGAETCADEYRNIIFSNCDIIHAAHMAMDIQNGDRADVHDVLFEDIRVEYSKYTLPCVYQESDEMEYPPVTSTHMPLLFNAELYCGRWSNDYLYGSNSNIRLKNIRVFLDESLPMPQIVLSGVNRDHMTKDITIEDYYVNGKKVGSVEEANIVMNEFVENVKVI
ncbi:MAG: hypothetical protein GX094_03925 [Clostridiales bacterium]|jgi:hypothetical protein|nr:hypothetical protein [Clostridiales bacterium]